MSNRVIIYSMALHGISGSMMDTIFSSSKDAQTTLMVNGHRVSVISFSPVTGLIGCLASVNAAIDVKAFHNAWGEFLVQTIKTKKNHDQANPKSFECAAELVLKALATESYQLEEVGVTYGNFLTAFNLHNLSNQ